MVIHIMNHAKKQAINHYNLVFQPLSFYRKNPLTAATDFNNRDFTFYFNPNAFYQLPCHQIQQASQ